LSRVSPGHLYYLFLDISPAYFSNIFPQQTNLENRKSENMKCQKPRFTNKCPILTKNHQHPKHKLFLSVYVLGGNLFFGNAISRSSQVWSGPGQAQPGPGEWGGSIHNIKKPIKSH